MPHDRETVEPWLRGTRQEVPALVRGVLHALDLTREDFARWVWPLGLQLLEERPYGLTSTGFQARHIVRSLDRLLTYAEGKALSDRQRASLAAESEADASDVRYEFEAGLKSAEERIALLPLPELEQVRYVGTAMLPVTLAGLLIHLADHTQRHAGQAVTTAKVLLALYGAERS